MYPFLKKITTFDFCVIINEVSKLEQYPIPQVEDLLSALAGGKSFTKLNITQAYQQLCLDEESQKLVVIDTHKELFKYKRVLLQSHPCRQKIG